MLRNCDTPPPPQKKMKRKTHASAIEMNWREREGNATRTRTRTHLPHPFTAAQTKLKTKKLHRFLTCGSETYASRIEIIEPTKRSRTHSPSFESVLALAPNGAAAKNSTTTPMAAPAMSAPDCGFSSSSPPNPPPSCLPFTAAPFLCRLQETDQLIWQENFFLKKRGVSFLVPLFLYASIAAFLSLVSAS